MTSYFDTEFFRGNRRRLRELYGKDAPIVITANGLMQRNADTTYPFRQDSSFWYLTGITEADVVFVMDGDDEYLIVPERDEVWTAFDGAIETEVMLRRSGAGMAYVIGEGWERLTKRLKQTKRVATLGAAPEHLDYMSMYTHPARARLVRQLGDAVKGVAIDDLRELVMQLRVIKQPEELQALQQAIDITIGSLEVAASRRMLRKYAFEFQADAELASRFILGGATGHSFESVIVAGKRACTMHNLAKDGELRPDELLLFDVGAEFEHYAADISRTYAIGAPTVRQEAVHAAVCAVQDHAYSLLRPGISPADYEQQVANFLGEKLQELGVIKRPADEGQYQEAIRRHFPHATSHFLGLDAHDVGDYRKPLQPGMVITVEPGIYIPEEGIGVRIEDDVLITENGHEVLSRRLSRSLV